MWNESISPIMTPATSLEKKLESIGIAWPFMKQICFMGGVGGLYYKERGRVMTPGVLSK